MDKLIELLNEYAPEDFNWCAINGQIFDSDRGGTIMNVKMGVYVISKQFGFIKRLVDNDKIDLDKYYEFMTNENIDISNACGELDMDKEFYYELLMILAVQDNPIEFLISILK